MNVRLKFDMPFTAGFYHDGVLRMNNYAFRLWMTTNSENARDQNTALERMKYFVYTQIDSTIFINSESADLCRQLMAAGLNVTTIPGDPVDQLIGIMLYYKLNAITEGRMIIVETEISSAYGENMTYIHGEFENTLGYVQPAWWTSSDLIHSDFEAENSEKVVAIPTSTAWRDLDMAWADADPADSDTGNVVVFANFKQPDATE